MYSTATAATNVREPRARILQLQSISKPHHKRCQVLQEHHPPEEVMVEEPKAIPSAGYAKLFQLHALLQSISLPLEEEEGKDEICNKDENQTDDHSTCC